MSIVSSEHKKSYVLKQFFLGFKNLGFRYVLLLWLIVFNYFMTFIKSKYFNFRGKRYLYFYHPYNHTWLNERTVEIPIIMHEIKNTKSGSILEIGNVLRRYYPLTHSVVDKYEKFPGVINQDAVDFKLKKKYDLIISISTMEHVGWDERPKDLTKIPRSLENMKKHLNKGGKIMITVPVGYNPHLNKLIDENKIFSERYFLKRKFANSWVESTWDEVKNIPYPREIAANALAVLVIKN